MDIDIEKTLTEVAKTPDKLEKSIAEVKRIRLESAKKLRWWVISLAFCLGLILGMVGTTYLMKSSEFACKFTGFGVEYNAKKSFVWCLSQIR